MKLNFLILGLFSLMTMACSYQVREGDAGVTAEEMMSMLGEVSGAQATSTGGGDLTGALAMKDQEGVRIYFAHSKDQRDGKGRMIDPMGPVASILSFISFDFIGQPQSTWADFAETRVFFFDLPVEGGRNNALIVGTRKASETAMTYAGFTGSGAMNEEDLVVTLQANGADRLVLRSLDVEGGDLENVIQMLVWDIDQGNEYYNGKFSYLIGFGD